MDKEHLIHLLSHNKKRIISILAVVVCFAIVSVGAGHSSKKLDPLYGAYANFTSASDDERLMTLVTEYYDAYCVDDIAKLEELAEPISDMERSYIEFMSDYTEKYDIVEIYSKPGIDNKSYLVSVSQNIKFKDIDSVSPGLDFIYVSTNDMGELYIDNRYGAFNQAFLEEETDAGIQELKSEFENQEDVVMLRVEIQNEYNELVDSDPDFDEFVNNTLPGAIAKWNSDYQAEVEAKEAQEAAAIAAEEAAREAEEALQEQIAAAQEAAAIEEEEAVAAQEATDEEVESMQTAANTNIKAGDTITVSDILNIRMEPDENSTKVGTVLKNGSVKILENPGANGWTKVKVNVKEGYIRTDLLK